MEIGKHFFIFSYMIAFLISIITITLNWFLYRKTKLKHYNGIHYFYLLLFVHIIINFVYFYKAYFIALWEWRLFILLLVNVSLALSLIVGLAMVSQLLAEKQEKEHKRNAVLLCLGAFYVVTYSVIRGIHPNSAVTFHGIWHSIFFVGSNLLFTAAGCYYCLKYFQKMNAKGASCELGNNRELENNRELGGNRELGNNRALLLITNTFLLVYFVFNFVIDTYYGMIEDKARLWGVNAYHMSVFLYLGFSAVLLLFYYRRIVFNSEEIKIETPLPAAGPPTNELMSLESAAEIYHLTSREKELAALVFAGYGNTKIAETLCISENTVKRHLSNIYHKMEINSRVELIKRLKSD